MSGIYLLSRHGRRHRSTRRRFFRYAFLIILFLGLCLSFIWWYISRSLNRNELASSPTPSSEASQPPSAVTLASYAPADPESLPSEPPLETMPEQTATPEVTTYPAVSWDIIPEILGDTATLSQDSFFDDAFFIGDSITTGLDKLEAFDYRPCLASIGLTLQKAAEEVTAFAYLKPAKIYILLGANDLTYYNMTEELYTERYLELIATLRLIFPEATIYPQSILPVATKYKGNPALTNDRITSYNQALATMCAEHQLTFIDIGQAWRLPDLSLHPEVTTDGLHIAYRYYGSWLQILKDNS